MDRLIEFHNVDATKAQFSPGKDSFPVLGGIRLPEDAPDWCFHMRNGRLVVQARPTEPMPSDTRFLPGTYVYGGIIHPHFGHQIAEFMHRLWVMGRPEYRDAIPVFLPAMHQWDAGLVEEVLRLMRLPAPFLVTEPVRFERLVVGETAKMIGGHPHPAYGEFLADRMGYLRPEPGTHPKRLAVLRGHLSSGRCLGEAWLERCLVAAGYVAFRPETLPLRAQIEHYLAAEKIMFSEGSAIHLADIMPPLTADVLVITRRNRKLPETTLTRKCANLRIVDGHFLGHPSFGDHTRPRSLAWLDMRQLMSVMVESGFIDASDVADLFADRDAIVDDVNAYVSAHLALPEGTTISSEELTRESLAFVIRGITTIVDELRRDRGSPWNKVSAEAPADADAVRAARRAERRAARLKAV